MLVLVFFFLFLVAIFGHNLLFKICMKQKSVAIFLKMNFFFNFKNSFIGYILNKKVRKLTLCNYWNFCFASLLSIC